MSNFPFAGRTREKERVWSLVASEMRDILEALDIESDVVISGFKNFLDRNYDDNVPYHGPVHVLYGLCYLFDESLNYMYQNLVYDCLIWLGHDAGHNGNSVESPEEKRCADY